MSSGDNGSNRGTDVARVSRGGTLNERAGILIDGGGTLRARNGVDEEPTTKIASATQT